MYNGNTIVNETELFFLKKNLWVTHRYMDSNGDMYNGNTIVNETEQRFSTGSKILVSLGFQRLRLVFSF